MKKVIISTLLVVATSSAFSQVKHIAPKNTIVLTDRQVMQIDSAIGFAASKIDSKAQTEVFYRAFTTFYKQVQNQMVADTVKKPVVKQK